MKAVLSFPGCHRKAGVERIMFECAHYLAQRNHSVEVLASEWEDDLNSKVSYRRVNAMRTPSFLYGLSYYQQARKSLLDMEYDILNTHGCVCPTGGVYWVQSVHRRWLDRSRTFRHPLSPGRIRQRINPLHPILLALERKHFRDRQYKKVIATTHDVLTDLHDYYGVPVQDIVVVPNGFSPTEFNPERRAERRQEMRNRLGLTKDDVVLLFVANELERKGYRTILDALKILNNPKLRLLVVGRPDRRVVRAIASEYGVASNVIDCGPTRNVAEYHAASDVFVLPTQYEAFCLAILEALGSGLPVVTTKVPGAHDAIEPNKNGFIIADPKSGRDCAAVLENLLDPACREQLSEGAAVSAIPYQWPNVLPRYEQVLLDNCA